MRPNLIVVILFCAATASAGDRVAPVCPVNGYIPYNYPAMGSCPCGEDGCFRPIRYYACDNGYEKSFWRRWLRAHFRGGSMLEGAPCQCISPPGRVYRSPMASPAFVPPESLGEIEPTTL